MIHICDTMKDAGSEVRSSQVLILDPADMSLLTTPFSKLGSEDANPWNCISSLLSKIERNPESDLTIVFVV